MVFSERTMTKKEKSKEDRLKDKYDDSDMKNNMKDQYGEEEGKKVYYATIRKQAMKKEEVEVEEGVIDAVKKGAKRHAKAVQAKKIKDRKAVPYAALAAENELEGEELKEYSPNVTYQAKGGKKSGKLGKSSVYSLRDKDESKKEFRKSQVKDIKGGYLKTEEKKKGLDGKECWDGYKLVGTKKKGGKTVDDCVKVKEEVVDEAKVDQGRSDYGKASIRNYRRKGPGHGEPAMFDPENKRGKTIDKRREEHKARRGVKGAKVPAYKVSEENALEKRAKENEKARKWLKKDAKDSGYTDIALKASMSKGAGVGEEVIPRGPGGNPIRIKDRIKAAKGFIPNKGKPTTEEVVSELNRYGKETGKATGSANKRAGTPVKTGGSTDDKALTFVRNMIRKETGKPSGQQKKVKGEKGRSQPGDRKFSPADTIAKVRQSRKDADAAMRDTRGT